MPEISIIVPVYNVEKYLSKCIDSILNQTFNNFELILVDDGSTDSSIQICDEYRMKDKRIKVIHKQNGGLSSARNAGLDIALGKYIGFVDSDDFIHKNMYQLLYSNLTKYNGDISICRFGRIFDGEKSTNIEDSCNVKVTEMTGYNALENLYNDKFLDFIVAWNKLYKREIFKDIRYPVGKIHEDEFIIHRILYESKKVIYIDKILYYYYQRDNSIMGKKFNLKSIDRVYAYKDRVDFFRKKLFLQLQYKAECTFTGELFEVYFKAKHILKLERNELKKIKKIFIEDLKNLIKNPKFKWKEKVMWIIFLISDNLYEKLIEVHVLIYNIKKKVKWRSLSGTNNNNIK